MLVRLLSPVAYKAATGDGLFELRGEAGETLDAGDLAEWLIAQGLAEPSESEEPAKPARKRKAVTK